MILFTVPLKSRLMPQFQINSEVTVLFDLTMLRPGRKNVGNTNLMNSELSE